MPSRCATLLLTMLTPMVVAMTTSVVVGQQHEIVGPLARDCRFTLADRVFDLCPIIADTRTTIVSYDPDPTGYGIGRSQRVVYLIDLASQSGFRRPTSAQCPEGTWICMKVTDHDQRVPASDERDGIPIARSTPFRDTPAATVQLESTARYASTVSLHLHGGIDAEGRPQSAHIRFVCDPAAREPSHPVALGPQEGVHSFIWRTRHACDEPAFSAASAEPDGGDENPPPPPGAGEEGLRDGFPSSSSRRRTTIVIVVLLATASGVTVLGYVAFKPRVHALLARLRRRLGIRPSVGAGSGFGLLSRVGEGRLVRWAEEDLELMEGEEDFMVNHMAADEIPLKPSPRHQSLRGYGATR